jgi:hypothetical protein
MRSNSNNYDSQSGIDQISEEQKIGPHIVF